MLICDHLLLDDLHHRVLDVVGELRLVQPVLEVLSCGFEVLSRGVGARAQNLHQATSKTLIVEIVSSRQSSAIYTNYSLTRLGRAYRRHSNQIA